jgi:Mg-chelatase subunit ChlD
MKNIFIFFLLTCSTAKSATSGTAPQPVGCLEADIIFLLDMSSSVRGYEPFIVDAVEEFSNSFALSDDGVKIGFATFASVLGYTLQPTGNNISLSGAIDTLRKVSAGSGTAMSPAFEFAYHAFVQSSNDRGNTPMRILICISDGELGDWESSVMWAKALRSYAGVDIYCINTDAEMSSGEDILIDIASSPRHYVASDYVFLAQVLKGLDACM